MTATSAPIRTDASGAEPLFVPSDRAELVGRWIVTADKSGARTINLVEAAEPAYESTASPSVGDPIPGSAVLTLDAATVPDAGFNPTRVTLRSELSSGYTLASKVEVAQWIAEAERRNMKAERCARYDPAGIIIILLTGIPWSICYTTVWASGVPFDGWLLAVPAVITALSVVAVVSASVLFGRREKKSRLEASANYSRLAAAITY